MSSPLSPSPSPAPTATVWFDGGCPLCVREIALMRRLGPDARLVFIDLATASQCPLDRRAMMQRFHAQEAGGPIVSGAAAFAVMWRAIPVLRPIGVLARFPPALYLLERLYRGFLRVRPALQAAARRGEAKVGQRGGRHEA